LTIEIHGEIRYSATQYHQLLPGEIMSQTPIKQDRGTPPQMPRWVKAFGIVLLILILIVIALHLTGNNLGGLIPHMP
jgi:hypothetical protein